MKYEGMEVKLKQKWCGFPAGYTTTLIKAKAEDMINRGVAEEVGAPKLKRKPGMKNRAIQSSSNE